VFTEDKKLSAIGAPVEKLAFKFKKDFPLLDGQITRIKDSNIVINLGMKNKIKEGFHFIIYRELPEKKDPATGKTVAQDISVIGKAVVTMASDDFSEVVIKDKKEPLDVQKDKVITE